MENKNWHISVNIKVENRTKNDILIILEKLKVWEESNQLKDGGVIIKENPVYDSFGNLWE